MSKRVQPMKSGKYSKNCFVNHASWEYEMISETEALLEPYREMLELYHSAYIELGRKIRQYSKTKVAQWTTQLSRTMSVLTLNQKM